MLMQSVLRGPMYNETRTMTKIDKKKILKDQLECAETKLKRSNCIRRNIARDFFDKIKNDIEGEELPRYWPPFFVFLMAAKDEQLCALEHDLNLVLENCDHKRLTQFLRANANGWRIWYGGLFDMWVRSALLRQNREVEFDALLPNGRDSDVRLKMGQKWVRLESTVLSQDDEWKLVWDRYHDAQGAGATGGLSRPGEYDPPNARGPSVYYNMWRFYAKVYDKATEKLDPDKSQFADDEPNVLLVSFCSIGGFTGSFGSYGWALDELFSAYRRSLTVY